MLVSIIIPIYKVVDYIERCLESVYEQTYQKIQIILVDDCSPDDSIRIAEGLISKYNAQDITKIIRHEKNCGLSEARNTGIRYAEGEYIYFLDSDDSIVPNTIQHLLELAVESKSEVSMADVHVLRETDSITIPNIGLNYDANTILISNAKIRADFFSKKWREMAWNKLIKKDFLLKHNLFFESNIYHEDLLWSFFLSLSLSRFAISTSSTYNYYLRSGSITQIKAEKHFLDRSYIINCMYQTASKDISLFNNRNFILFVEDLKFYVLYDCADYMLFKKCNETIGKGQALSLYKSLKLRLPKRLVILSLLNKLPYCISFSVYKLINKIK